MLNKKILVSLAIAATAGMAACSSTPTTTDTTATPTSSSGLGTNPNTYGNAGGNGTSGGDLASISQHTVYFDFDSSSLKAESGPVVTAWAKYLSNHPTSKIRVEGNTDERGTREYNVALGERRSNAVATALEAQGVSAAQLSIVSYGEEHPVALGHDEDSWSQNRRVDLMQ